ncbi:MAG: aldehyde dehydrogenase [Myxococcota bacterium]|nr:aldehyde dehydrogenase [Myxococcota bacterium]
MLKLSNLIGGEFTPALGGEVLENINPANQEVISTIPRSNGPDVDRAVDAAGAAFKLWRVTDVRERADFLEAIGDEINIRLDEFAEAESRDTGKPISLASTLDIPRAISNFRFFAGAIRQEKGEAFHGQAGLNYTIRKPLGVVGLITPWNLPLYLMTWKVAPALAMGNAIVAKPSEMTPTTATLLGEVINKLSPTPGLYNLIHGLGNEVGEPLVNHDGIAAISFTGGTKTGGRVAACAAPKFKKLSLELGGKNPTVVFGDADFETAVDGAVRAGFANQGQVCLCGSRLLIDESIWDNFVDAFVAKVKAMKVGDPGDWETQVGALISLEHRDKVSRFVEKARALGGTVLVGGKSPRLEAPHKDGAFYEPTVIVGLDHGCEVVQQEIFGPVVTLHPFKGEAEALALANDVQYGLSASIWTRDLARAHRFAQSLEAGMVWINTWLMRDLRTPFGGVKESGMGREGGAYSLSFYSEPQNICVNV